MRASRRASGVTALFLAGSAVAVAFGVVDRGQPSAPGTATPVKPGHVAVWPVRPDAGPAELATQDNSRVGQIANLATLHLAQVRGEGRQPSAYTVPSAPTPTLVLTPRHHPYLVRELLRLAPGAIVAQGDGAYLARENILVQAGATLRLASQGRPLTLRLRSDPRGFVTLTSFGGRIVVAGTTAAPVTLESWDSGAATPDLEVGDGRAYLRTIGGTLSIADGRFGSLGFAEGPTSGVTAGRATSPRLASLVPAVTVRDSRFTGGAEGLLVSGASRLHVIRSEFDGNLLSGLELHQPASDSELASDHAAGNGLDGFTVRGGEGVIRLQSDKAVRNGRAGFSVAGRSVTGEIAGGAEILAAEAEGNAVVGVELADAMNSVVRGSRIGDSPIGVIVSGESQDVTVASNQLSDLAQRAVYVHDGPNGVSVVGNQIVKAAVAVNVRDSSVDVTGNTIGIAVYDGRLRHAISFTGGVATSRVDGNRLSGNGWSAVDATQVETGRVVVTGNDLGGWVRMHGRSSADGPWLTWPTVARLVMILLFGVLVMGRYRPGAPQPRGGGVVLPRPRVGEDSAPTPSRR